MSETILQLAAWLLTYALHSTVLLGIAALLTARWVRGEAWRETLWKAALVGGLVTATVQSAGWIVGDMGRWRLAALSSAAPAGTPSPGTSPAAARHESIQPPLKSSTDPARTVVPLNTAAALDATSPPAAAPAPSRAPRTPLGWAMLAWALGAAGMLVRLALRQARLRRLLAGRTQVEDDAVFAMLAGLRRNAGIWRPVHLTRCAATPTPLALGGGEICVPPRFLTDLDAEQQRSALAHELAHVARHDPAWHFGVSILEALFFFQPLNRLARARLRESAEFLCDEWAARQTGSPLGLARCLAEVASWVAPGRHPIPAGTMAMAEGGSPLVQRVQRLTAWRGEPREGSGPLRVAAAVVLIGTVAAIAPAIASPGHGSGPQGAPSGSAPDSSSTPSASPADESRQDIVVIPHPAPDQPLARRWAWAVEEIGRRGLERGWVAWSIPTPLSPGPTWLKAGSGGERVMVNRRLGAPADHTMMLFTVARDGQLEHAVGHSAEVDLSRQPVLWLGPARGDESFAQIRRMADGLRDPDQRQRLVEAVGIHHAEGVVPYLAAVLGRDGSNGVRREAAYALGRHRSDESLAALRTAVERDGSGDVRREAVDAIARLRVAQSGATLHDLAVRASDLQIRRAAVEALGMDLDAQGMRTLTAIASLDRDPVARDAVEAMEHGPAELVAPALVRLAWTSGNRVVARQAAESLGRLPAPWAVVALDSIARMHPDPGVAQQAVEALGGYPGAVAGGYIRQIARTHREVRVREEALDQLREARGDADPDPGYDSPTYDEPGYDPDPEPDPDLSNTLRASLQEAARAQLIASSAIRAGAATRP